eukprot:2354215-Prymnesium_polylepis.1
MPASVTATPYGRLKQPGLVPLLPMALRNWPLSVRTSTPVPKARERAGAPHSSNDTHAAVTRRTAQQP